MLILSHSCKSQYSHSVVMICYLVLMLCLILICSAHSLFIRVHSARAQYFCLVLMLNYSPNTQLLSAIIQHSLQLMGNLSAPQMQGDACVSPLALRLGGPIDGHIIIAQGLGLGYIPVCSIDPVFVQNRACSPMQAHGTGLVLVGSLSGSWRGVPTFSFKWVQISGLSSSISPTIPCLQVCRSS